MQETLRVSLVSSTLEGAPYVFFGQSWQVVAPVELMYRPLAHAAHLGVPTFAVYEPASQGSHSDNELAPGSVRCVPTGQGMHESALICRK
jgi:hypothetical protein